MEILLGSGPVLRRELIKEKTDSSQRETRRVEPPEPFLLVDSYPSFR